MVNGTIVKKRILFLFLQKFNAGKKDNYHVYNNEVTKNSHDFKLLNLGAKTSLIYIITLCSELHKEKTKVYITLQQIPKTLLFKPWHVFPAVQVVMWFKTFFIVRQWGKLQGFRAPF